MALTELQKRKFKAAFDSQDFDGSGVLTQEDFDGFFAQIKRFAGQNLTIEELLQKQWSELNSKADVDKNGGVTLEEWYDYLDDLMNDPKRFEDYIIQTAKTLLALINPDENAIITLEEYTKFVKALSVESREAEIAFKKLDKSGDGRLSIGEFLKNVREFYFNKDDEKAPSNWLFGKF